MIPSFDVDAMEERIRQAQLGSDVAELDALLDDDLFFTSYDGKVYSKFQDLEAHRMGLYRLFSMTPSERHVIDLGDTAVVSVRMDVEGEVAGEPVQEALRYTRVWAHRDGRWRIVAGHLGPISGAET